VRALVLGSSGAGKTRFARTLAERVGATHVELDAIYHQPNWQSLPDEDFRAVVSELANGTSWVIDGNYWAVRSLIVARATTIVWLDYRKSRVMCQVLRRSVFRGLLHSELWNGNRESPRAWMRSDHPIRYSWSNFAQKRAEFAVEFAEPAADLEVKRFQVPGQARRWLDCVPRAAGWDL
jgi:adenylate kinase family enzyme